VGGSGEGAREGNGEEAISQKIPAQMHKNSDKKSRARGEKVKQAAFCYLYFDFWCLKNTLVQIIAHPEES